MELRADAIPDRAIKQRERLEELEEEVRQLRELLLPVFIPPEEWELTPAEVDVLRLLATRSFVTKDIAAVAIDVDAKTLAVLISRLRRKVRGIEIKNQRDRGYFLEPWHKEAILQSSREWIRTHELEVADHENLVRVFEMISKVDADRLERVLRLVRYVQKFLR